MSHIHTIFDIYHNKSKAAGHGRIKFLFLWSDNCGDQLTFKNKYHFGWGSAFLQQEGILNEYKHNRVAVFGNYTIQILYQVFGTVSGICKV